MRYGRNGKIYEDNGKFIGINLGADFVAEHEHGIKELMQKFKCNDKLKGLKAHKIEYGRINNCLDKDWYILTSSETAIDKDNGIQDYILEWPEQELDFDGYKVDMKAGWDEKDFAILLSDRTIFDTLYEAFVNKNITLSLGESEPFSNGGLNILIYDRIPKEMLKESEKLQIEYENKKNKLENSKEYEALIDKRKEWKDKYPFARHSPWDFMFLGNFDGKKFWLNPKNQSHINYGWFTLSDLNDWVNGEGVIPMSKELFEDLKIELSIPLSTWAFNPIHDSGYRKHFRGIPLNLWRDNDAPLYTLGKKEKGNYFYKMDIKMIDLIESRIKRMLVDDMFCQMGIYSFEQCNEEKRKEAYKQFVSTLKNQISVRKQTQDEVSGMFWMLRLQGYGDYGPCNIPEGDEFRNLSYWKNRLEYEAEYDFFNLCGMMPESWKLDFNKEQENE